MAEYTKAQIAKRVGVPKRTVQYWIDRELLRPSIWTISDADISKYGEEALLPVIEEATRRGKTMIFSEEAVIQLHCIKILQKSGFHLETIYVALELLRANVWDFFRNPIWEESMDIIICQSLPDGKPLIKIIEKERYTESNQRRPGHFSPHVTVEKLDPDGNFKFPLPEKGINGYLCMFLGEVKRMAVEAAGQAIERE